MSVVYPHTFQDNVEEVASGVQVDENFSVIRAALEALDVVVVHTSLGSAIKVSAGTGTLTWSSGQQGNSGKIAHGLAVLPRAILVTLAGAGPGAPIGVYYDSVNTNEWEAHGWAAVSTSGTVGFSWLAIG